MDVRADKSAGATATAQDICSRVTVEARMKRFRTAQWQDATSTLYSRSTGLFLPRLGERPVSRIAGRRLRRRRTEARRRVEPWTLIWAG